jgi:hypothetical protein
LARMASSAAVFQAVTTSALAADPMLNTAATTSVLMRVPMFTPPFVARSLSSSGSNVHDDLTRPLAACRSTHKRCASSGIKRYRVPGATLHFGTMRTQQIAAPISTPRSREMTASFARRTLHSVRDQSARSELSLFGPGRKQIGSHARYSLVSLRRPQSWRKSRHNLQRTCP